jgi:S1-C subfamily serine protease
MNLTPDRIVDPHGDHACERPLPIGEPAIEPVAHPPNLVVHTSMNRKPQSQRGRRTFKGNLLRLSGITLLMIVPAAILATMFAGWPRIGSQRRFARAIVLPGTEIARPVRDASSPPSRPAGAPSPEWSAAENSADRVLEALQHRVVKIESDDPGGAAGLGSGFLVGSGGLVATSFHVIAEATRASVTFQNVAVYEVAGYAAVDPDVDLAILQLTDAPASLTAMPLRAADDPPQLTPVVAIGHPQGIEFAMFDGTVSKVLDTQQLPGHARQFLTELIAGGVNHRWIQHTARISEGSSGGPLINRRGEVIGINTWVDRHTGTGYAIHVRFLQRLLDEQMLPAVASLEKFARRDARTVALLQRLSPARIRQLVEDAEAMNWRPADETDYDNLGQLAWAITFANLPSSAGGRGRPGGLDERPLADLIAEADRAMAKLRREKWDGPGQVTIINEFAATRINTPRAGAFFFAEVERIVAGDDGSRAAILRLSGLDQPIFVPLEGQLTEPQPGASCLVLGVNYDGRTVRYGDNPLRPTIAPVLISRTILPLSP